MALFGALLNFSIKRNKRLRKLENLKADPDQTKLQKFKKYGVTSIIYSCLSIVFAIVFFLFNKSFLNFLQDNKGIIVLLIFGALYLMYFILVAMSSFLFAIFAIYDAHWQKKFRKSALSTTALILSVITLAVSVIAIILGFIF